MEKTEKLGDSNTGIFATSLIKQEKNEGFLPTARHGYKEGGHGVFRGGEGMGGVPPTPKPSDNVVGLGL